MEEEFEILRLGVNGEGIAKRGDGYTFFVDEGLPGEIVTVDPYEKKKKYGRARIKKLLLKSPSRVDPPCPLFGRCGGCQLMHINDGEQLLFKRQRVVDAIERIAHLKGVEVAPCLPSPQTLHYRNKIQLPVVQNGRGLELGLYARHTHQVIAVETCLIHCSLGELAYQVIKAILQKAHLLSTDSLHGLRHVLIKTALSTSQVLVVFVAQGVSVDYLRSLANEAMEVLPEIKGVVYSPHSGQGNRVLGEKCELLAGAMSIEEELNGLTFNISAASFFQVNPGQAKQLYEIALSFLMLKGDEYVVDAYCGVGTLSLLAAQVAKEVIGIESVFEAIEDAKENGRKNGINNVEFVCALAQDYIKQLKRVDCAILNPPRKGCERSLLETLDPIGVKRIVYISCDPATLARDLEVLTQAGWQIEAVRPVDMFPQTAHVETVVSLRRA